VTEEVGDAAELDLTRYIRPGGIGGAADFAHPDHRAALDRTEDKT